MKREAQKRLIHILIPLKDRRIIKALAEEKGMSFAEYLRRIITNHLTELKEKQNGNKGNGEKEHTGGAYEVPTR